MKHVMLLFLFAIPLMLTAQPDMPRFGHYESGYHIRENDYRGFSLDLNSDSTYSFNLVDSISIECIGDYSMRNDSIFVGGIDFFKDNIIIDGYDTINGYPTKQLYFEVSDKYKKFWKGPKRMYCDGCMYEWFNIKLPGTYTSVNDIERESGRLVKLVLGEDSTFSLEVKKKNKILLSDTGTWKMENNWIVLHGQKHFFRNDRFFAFPGYDKVAIRFETEKKYQSIWNTDPTSWGYRPGIYLECRNCAMEYIKDGHQ